MRKQLLRRGGWRLAMAVLSAGGLAACSSNNPANPVDSGSGPMCDAGALPSNYVVIDDMETTTHGPIQFSTGIVAPLTQGYWYNSGASYVGTDGGASDTSNPPQMSFVFSPLPSQTTTAGCHVSKMAARQSCTLNGLYDTCGLGFEFAQKPDPNADAGAPAGDAGMGEPKLTVPFDISRYKAVTFWGMTTTPDPMKGSMQVKISFPDTDTDPRGQICNGGGGNTSKCYNSYAANFAFTTTWQKFTVMLDPGMDGVPPANGIAIDPSWGYQQAKWIPTEVYGVNWQAQRNVGPDEAPPLMTDIWIDDVYFLE